MKETDTKNEKTVKMGRQRYFQMSINIGLSGPKLHLWTKNINKLIDLLVISEFVSQEILEKTLYHLIIVDRGRVIYLEDFDGQLESDSQGMPYWNIYLKTNALTTSRCIAKSISKELFKTKNTIDSTIQIHPLRQFQKCQREKLFPISKSNFYPGYFSWITMKTIELLETNQVKESIKKTPEKYGFLIDLIKNSDELENTKL